jgi:mannose-1-phosphate guanylyltransferase/mannose-1-phosphate guanylyltransferase/mannose-6-phosphate isomerase
MFDNCIILAGGSGARLWPASSSRLPKQFLPASQKKSFFSMAVERALKITKKSGKVIIITGKRHIPLVITDAGKFSASEKKRMLVIGEPSAKNTSAAIACAAVFSHFGGLKKVAVLTSDHLISPIEIFKTDMVAVASVCAQGKLALLGIKPSRSDTGYGYIETGKASGNIFDVKTFHEKPDMKTAKKYVKSSCFFWNSGMFAFDTGFIINEFRLHAPQVILPFEKLKEPKTTDYKIINGIRILNKWNGLEAAYNKTLNISFDFSIAEKCRETVMLQANFDWVDVGNWEEYIKICGKNHSEIYRASKESCYVDSDIPVALAGVEDLIIVIRSGKNGEPSSALITRKGQTGKIQNIVEQIKKSGNTSIL